MNKQEEIDYSEINAIEASANISPIDDSKEFTLETELQRLLHYIKHIAINIENPEEYNKQICQANEIKRSFEAEGWKEVPKAERENAISGNCWIDERNMDPMEPRKGTRFFIIDTKQLKWSFYFKTKTTSSCIKED